MTDQQKLTSVVAEGLSLVLCTGGIDQMLAIESALCRARLACVSTRWMTSMNAIGYARSWVDAMAHRHVEDEALVLLARVPTLSMGYRLPFHRIVWIGKPPSIVHPLYATYKQATNRGEADTPVLHFNGDYE